MMKFMKLGVHTYTIALKTIKTKKRTTLTK